MTSNVLIEYLLKCETSFLGCFHIENLPPRPKKLPASLVIYSEEHWLGLKLVNKTLCLYFDSFGKPIIDAELINYLLPNYRNVMYNSVQIQHDKSDKCGLFCILFIKLVDSFQDFKHFVHFFHRKNLHYNDLLIDEIKFT